MRSRSTSVFSAPVNSPLEILVTIFMMSTPPPSTPIKQSSPRPSWRFLTGGVRFA